MNIKNWILALLAAMTLIVMPAVAVEVRGVPFDQASAKYNNTLSWDAETFPGFWYAIPAGKSSEILKIDQPAFSLTAKSREIEPGNLIYKTDRSKQNYRIFLDVNKKLENGDSFYYRLGWFGNLYIAANGRANKLAKLVKEQKKEEVQTLKLGESWSLGEGYNVTFDIDAETSPRQTMLILSKDGKTLAMQSVSSGEVFTYLQQKLGSESNVPVFVTYVESVFAGTGNETVQLRYTWLISQNVTEVKSGDRFGVFEVKEADENHLFLYNKDKSISLGQNTVVDLAGGIKFRVADSATVLRFYPFKDVKDPAPAVQTQNQTTPVVQAPAVTTPLPTSVAQETNNSTLLKPELIPEPAKPAQLPEKTALQKIFGFWGTYLVLAVITAGIFILRPDKKVENPETLGEK